MKRAWWVYVLCCRDRSLYAGIALDVQERLKTHRSGKGSKYVRSRCPVKLVLAEKHASRSAALKREAQIKGLKRSEKLALLKGRR